MKRIILIITLAAVLAGIGWVIFVPKQASVEQGQAQKDVYYCPMHPHYTSDRPGNCPICGMSLVKKQGHPSAEHALKEHAEAVRTDIANHAPVAVPVAQQQLMGIKTAVVASKPLVKTIRAYGRVAHDLELYEAQLEYIDAWREYALFLARRPVKDEYRDSWREYYKSPSGKPRSEEFRRAQQRLIKAEYEMTHMGLTGPQLEQLRKIKYGQPWIQPDLLFFQDKQSAWVYADIFETDIGFVDVGQKAYVEIPAFGETFEGAVRVVSSVVDPVSRTVRVRIELPKMRSDLKADMYANVAMPVELNEAPLVPINAVIDTGEAKIIFVETSPAHFEPRAITVSFAGDGYYQVKGGARAGETIVLDGNFLLDSESRLQAALQGQPSAAKGEKAAAKGGHHD